MMTQTHLLVGAAMLARPEQRLRNAAVVVGSLLPDAAIYTLFAWSKAVGLDEETLWRETYFSEPWKSWVALGNSIPVYVLIGLIGVVLLRIAGGVWRIGLFLAFVGLAALIHLAGDLPVHVNDAHSHFYPLSDWKFVSPISYWDPNHHGAAFSVFEALLGVLLAVILYRRFRPTWVRTALAALIAAYVLTPLYFFTVLGDPSQHNHTSLRQKPLLASLQADLPTGQVDRPSTE